jgi:hypothetical protein
MRRDAARASEVVMTSLGLQLWAQLLSGIRIAFGHMYFTELCDVLRALGNSYRLASTTGGGSGFVYGRFTAGFCRAIVARTMSGFGDRASVLTVTRFD